MKTNKNLSLVEIIKKHGIENCIFMLKMHPLEKYFGIIAIKSSNSPEYVVPCEICEERYKLEDEYKITLKARGEYYDAFGKEHFYISDLENLIESGSVEFFVRGEFV